MVGVPFTEVVFAVAVPVFARIHGRVRTILANDQTDPATAQVDAALRMHRLALGLSPRLLNTVPVLGPALAAAIRPPAADLLTHVLQTHP